MKTQLLILLLTSSIIPSSSSINLDCLQEGNSCYDSNLEIQVGDVFSWKINEHYENGHFGKYNPISGESHTISFEVIRDFRGLERNEVYQNSAEYFNIKSSIDDNLSIVLMVPNTGPVNQSINQIAFIAPTLITSEDVSNNIYRNSFQDWQKYRISFDWYINWNYTVFFTQAITNDIYDYSEFAVVTEKFNNSNIILTSLLGASYNIHNGLLLQLIYEEQKFIFGTNSSLALSLVENEVQEFDIPLLHLNLQMVYAIIFVAIVIAIVFSILIYRKIDF